MTSLTLDRLTSTVVPASRTLDRLWTTGWSAPGLAAVLVTGVALVSAWLTPRGPLTATQVVVTVVVMLATGAAVGVLTGRRLAMLIGPLLFVVVFELGRLGTEGATVEVIDVSSFLGVAALVAGRGVHALFALLPMAIGTASGVWIAHRLGHPVARAPGLPGITATAVAALAVIALTAASVVPGSTAPIVGPDGRPLPGSIAELVTVEIGGVEQVIMLRGRDADAPVLLHLAGGPGGTDIGAMRADTSLEDDWVVATWEQRGTGQSYATSIEPVEDLTVEQAVGDTIEVAEYLRDRFDEQRIVITGNSWGTIPATLAVQRAPELFHAYVGTGQMVSNRLTDQLFHEDALAWAEETGRDDLASRLRAVGPPPYDDLMDYQVQVGTEHQWNAYPGVDDLDEMPFNTFVPENDLLDRVNAIRGLLDVNWFVYPQLQDHDFRVDVPRLDVPVYVVLGEHEARGRDVLAREWIDRLEAPTAELVVFDGAGHRPSFERPAEFAALMARVQGDHVTDAAQ